MYLNKSKKFEFVFQEVEIQTKLQRFIKKKKHLNGNICMHV